MLILALFYTNLLTHSGESELQPSLSQAIQTWGRTSSIQDAGPGPDIYITYGQTPGSSSAYPELVSGVIRSCRIEVNPEYRSAPSTDGLYEVILHELGHCLGLTHPDSGESIMRSLIYGFTAEDEETISRLYPRKVFIPSLSRN